MSKRQIQILFHYDERDTEFKGDYTRVDIILDGVRHRSYGDYLHDKGGVQAESYVQGYVNAVGPELFNVTRDNIADY